MNFAFTSLDFASWSFGVKSFKAVIWAHGWIDWWSATIFFLLTFLFTFFGLSTFGVVTDPGSTSNGTGITHDHALSWNQVDYLSQDLESSALVFLHELDVLGLWVELFHDIKSQFGDLLDDQGATLSGLLPVFFLLSFF